MVGGLLDLERAVGLTLDDDDTVDVEVPMVFNRAQGLVGLTCRRGVVGVSDEEGRSRRTLRR